MTAFYYDTSVTKEQYKRLPENTRAEKIDGIYFMSPAPTRMHQRIVTRLSSCIDRYISENGGSCEVYSAPFDVILGEDTFQPDISVICDTKKLTEQGCSGAPDWIIEVASPTSGYRDYTLKRRKYLAAGVREYWVADSSQQTVDVYLQSTPSHSIQYSFNEAIPVNIYPGFTVRLSDLL